MTQDKKEIKIPNAFITNDTNYISAFRQNVLLCLSENDITINDLAEYSNLPIDTLKSFLYKNLKDCKLSTAIALAKALNISIDELTGANTFCELTRESLALCRNLPEHALHLVRWHIRHQDFLYNRMHKDRIVISVAETERQPNGNLILTSRYEPLDITDLSRDITSKIFFGIRLPCDYYMPTYSHYDILLMANDREPMNHENTVIIYNGIMGVVKRKVENGTINYYSIRDGKFRTSHNDRIEVVGYVAGVCH